jgi:hypothetical protein
LSVLNKNALPQDLQKYRRSRLSLVSVASQCITISG